MTTKRSDTVRLRLPASVGSVPRFRHEVSALCERFGASTSRRDDVRLAVTEACTNAILHAYVDCPPGEHEVEVEAFVHHDRVRVTVRDFGRGVRPRPDSPGLGVGMSLIALVAESVEIRSVIDRPPHEVVMVFPLP